ncbi:LOW QUALITY PROTEIN: thrombospondin type-1 domain-containing protein 4 [Lethenteron reissneri]|uniref:LOW QUALITY PROTEIN: thrombospondin type-1 domain-containing protein 4 n=1 Tax=Lethenteron reissneri TaxID=7753 RepID=UPI002AB611CB|nr:LOW QUALITY PROTEIN: thrombospondin type-1 domain-containing protein 4 [Lethenteron reissneri]
MRGLRAVCCWLVAAAALVYPHEIPPEHRKVRERIRRQLPGSQAEEVDTGPPGQGTWGPWGPWSDCSRTCGGGVRMQTRECLPQSQFTQQQQHHHQQHQQQHHPAVPPHQGGGTHTGLHSVSLYMPDSHVAGQGQGQGHGQSHGQGHGQSHGQGHVQGHGQGHGQRYTPGMGQGGHRPVPHGRTHGVASRPPHGSRHGGMPPSSSSSMRPLYSDGVNYGTNPGGGFHGAGGVPGQPPSTGWHGGGYARPSSGRATAGQPSYPGAAYGRTAAFSLYTRTDEGPDAADGRDAGSEAPTVGAVGSAGGGSRAAMSVQPLHGEGDSSSTAASSSSGVAPNAQAESSPTDSRSSRTSIRPGRYGYGRMPVMYSAIKPADGEPSRGDAAAGTNQTPRPPWRSRQPAARAGHPQQQQQQPQPPGIASLPLYADQRGTPLAHGDRHPAPRHAALSSHGGGADGERPAPAPAPAHLPWSNGTRHPLTRLDGPEARASAGLPVGGGRTQSRGERAFLQWYQSHPRYHGGGGGGAGTPQPVAESFAGHAHSRAEQPYGYRPRQDASRQQQQQHRMSKRSPEEEQLKCSGLGKQYKLCNLQACSAGSRDAREMQCSSYNGKPFMGRYYEWVPFLEVREEQKCELNCRAVGYRFYVRHAERATDGTPCEPGSDDVCMEGTCKTVGCDGILGSDNVVDKCGVCGGDNTACKVVSGVYKRSATSVGYHKILEIPKGAIKINITEMSKSRNYLALRSHAGQSIINGNWAIDRPGKYEAAGTMFMYKRPNEISSTAGESFIADGPTTDVLDVFMIYQQSNPGVHFEYVLPSDNVVSSQLDPNPPNHNLEEAYNGQLSGSAIGGGGGGGGGGRGGHSTVTHTATDPAGGHLGPGQPGVPPASPWLRDYNWKRVGTTECSSTCGRGKQLPVFRCVRRTTQEEVSDTNCDSSSRPPEEEEACNVQPCPAFWDLGEWSECSKTCGTGNQHRQVLCRQVYAGRVTTVQPHRCRTLEKPETTTTCQLKICSEWQTRSEWSSCSVPCGLGQRSRDVKCVSNLGDAVDDGECNMKLRPADSENCDMGACAKSWFLTDWSERCSADCGEGVQSRSVVCLMNHVNSLPLEGCSSDQPTERQACNYGSCETKVEWFTGPWGQCSVGCGNGTQSRDVICVQRTNGSFSAMDRDACAGLAKPPSQQPCHLRACGARWYTTAWSACSKSCETGFRVREVRCLDDSIAPSSSCDAELKPSNREDCNTQACIPEIDENCKDKYFNCNVVVQARLCVYNYYKTVCCASCTRAANRARRIGRR